MPLLYSTFFRLCLNQLPPLESEPDELESDREVREIKGVLNSETSILLNKAIA